MGRYKQLATWLLAALALASSAPRSEGEAHYITTATQGSTAYGPYWSSAPIWQMNGAGPLVAATNPSSYYEATNNGTFLGNNTTTTILRNPWVAGTPSLAVFTGDSLVLDTNTQIRFKALGAAGTTAPGGLVFATPTNGFYGSNGLPGLVLNGGCLNAGDGYDFVILGTMQAAPGTVSYLDPADSLAGDFQNRALMIAAQLSGSGTLVVLNATNSVPQMITGASNTYSGRWILKAGWLQGAGDGTQDGYNSLGTNTASSFVVDPLYTPAPTFDASAVFNNGPAILDLGSAPLANCGGKLTLTNGGALYLHGNAVFNAVTIEGAVLANGTHSFAFLSATYPNNFVSPPGQAAGFGTLTVQPYGPAPPLAPAIVLQPEPQRLFAGGTAHFASAGTGLAPLSYVWQRFGTNLVDGGNISGSATTVLTVTGVSVSDATGYAMVISNPAGSATSSVAPLAIVAPSGETYEAAVKAKNPIAFYELNDSGNPATNALAYDFASGYNAVYGSNVLNAFNGVAGPRPAQGFPGFLANNAAAQFTHGAATSFITVPAINPLTNAAVVSNLLTITAWINPSGAQNYANGIVSCRGGATVAGLGYAPGYTDLSGNYTLGYNWNNDYYVWSWNSSLVAPPGRWSLVALVVTPTNATLSVMSSNRLASSTHVYNHVNQPFASALLIGDDSYDGGNGSRVFNGLIDDVAIFNTALSLVDVTALYSAASGVTNFPPYINEGPTNEIVFAGQVAQFVATAGGSPTISYQWRAGPTGGGVYTNLSDGSQFFGSATPILSIASVGLGNAADYVLVAANGFGSVTSSVATLTVEPTGPPMNITFSGLEAIGQDWNTTGFWNDGLGGLPASVSAVEYPGSTYELLPGSLLRTPSGNAYNNTFPGAALTNDGTGVFTNINVAASTDPCALLRLKQANPGAITNPAIVAFPRLVMNGGEVDAASDGLVVLQGEIDINSNAVFYVDSAGGPNRWIQIDSFLTGSASIEYHAFDTSLVGDLNISGSSNTYSGTWNVVQGALLGTGTNSLGTNTITVGVNGALETTYDIHNPNGSLILNGQMFLHQNDTFGSVAVGGNALAPGAYSFTTLAATYSNYFPVTWPPQMGAASFSTGSGSLTVLGSVPRISWTNPAPITYGTALGSNQLNAFASVPGTNVYNPPLGTVLNTGTQKLSVTFTPTDAVDYSSVTTSVSLVVLPAPLTVAANSTNRAYGAANPAFTDTITGLANGDNITATNTCAATVSSPPGTYSIMPGLIDPSNRSTNYTTSLIPGALTVLPIGQPLPGVDLGNPSSPGSTVFLGPGSYDVVAGGNDIFFNNDQFQFSYQVVTGDFDAEVAVTRLDLAGYYAKAGLMARADLSSGSPNVDLLVTPLTGADTYQFHYRAAENGSTSEQFYCCQPALFPNAWLRLKRMGNTFAAYYGTNGTTWQELGQASVALPPSVCLGLATTAESTNLTTFASYRGYEALFLTAQPEDQTVWTGISASFTVNASGGPPVAYQWQFNGANLTDNAQTTGSQSNTLAVGNVLASNAGHYQAVVANAYGSVTSSVATLSVLTGAAPTPVWASLYTNYATANFLSYDYAPVTCVDVTFSGPMDPSALLNATNYSFSAGSGITAANITGITVNSNSYREVELALNTSPRLPFTVTVQGMRAQGGGPPLAGTSVTNVDTVRLTCLDIGLVDGQATLSGNDPAVPTTLYVDGPRAYTVQCEGSDIWNTNDGFNFLFEQKSGDFDMVVRQIANTHVSNWTKGGLMIRETFDPDSRNWSVVNDPDSADGIPAIDGSGYGANTVECTCRPSYAAASTSWAQREPPVPPAYPNAWVRLTLQRGYMWDDGEPHEVSDIITAYASTNGTLWVQLAQMDAATNGVGGLLADPLYVGICSTAHDNDAHGGTYGQYIATEVYADYTSSYINLRTLPTLIIATSAGDQSKITISWSPNEGTLMSSPAVRGPNVDWQPVGTANPAVLPITGSAQFFRVKVQ